MNDDTLREQQEPSKSPVLVYGALAFVVIVIALGAVAFLTLTRMPPSTSESILLRDVPAFNIYTYQGEASYLAPGSAALASVFEYWQPGSADMQAMGSDLRLLNLPLGEIEAQGLLIEVATERGYNARAERLSFARAAAYLKEEQTPLIYMLQFNDTPIFSDPMTFPAVLVGIDEESNTLTFQSYWFGPLYQVSRERFEERNLYRALGSDEEPTYEFLVIQPTEFDAALGQIATRDILPYPERTLYMDLIAPLLEEYVNGFYLFHAAAWAQGEEAAAENLRNARERLERLTRTAEFDMSFPPFFQVSTWQTLAQVHLIEGDLDAALVAIEKASMLNMDLNQPQGAWPGVQMTQNAPGFEDRVSKVDRTLGDIYRARGEIEEARAAYSRALEIMPANTFAQRSLDELEPEATQ